MFLSDREREFIHAVAKLNYTNPFLPERIEQERIALGDQFEAGAHVWSARTHRGRHPNVERIGKTLEELMPHLLERVKSGKTIGKQDRKALRDAALYHLYYQNEDWYYHIIAGRSTEPPSRTYRNFLDQYRRLITPLNPEPHHQPDHLFALFFQIRRAFHYIFDLLIGGSMPMAKLRAMVWQSIFSHNTERYSRGLYKTLNTMPTLITGPSGSGKDLIAEALGYSGYIPFSPEKGQFIADFRTLHHPIQISALTPTLVESELFGHRRGAFTGALTDRAGRLEQCTALGAAFLDEIGEIDPSIQVKLLRVLQNRTFYRLGDGKARQFEGKILAATNRNLALEIEQGRFREDLYYRLCADRIETPTLLERLQQDPNELDRLVDYIAHKIAGPEEGPALSNEVSATLKKTLPPNYPWPGNVRELEQAVRNILIRGAYQPLSTNISDREQNELDLCLQKSRFTADQLLNRYCRIVYEREGSYVAAGQALNLDRRVVTKRAAEDS